MWEVILQNKAQETLDYLYKYEKSFFDTVINILEELSIKWRNRDKLKDIGNWVKRIRAWRRRILCTHKKNIYVWIIALEKDTDKDYGRRKKYILQQLGK